MEAVDANVLNTVLIGFATVVASLASAWVVWACRKEGRKADWLPLTVATVLVLGTYGFMGWRYRKSEPPTRVVFCVSSSLATTRKATVNYIDSVRLDMKNEPNWIAVDGSNIPRVQAFLDILWSGMNTEFDRLDNSIKFTRKAFDGADSMAPCANALTVSVKARSSIRSKLIPAPATVDGLKELHHSLEKLLENTVAELGTIAKTP